MARINVNPTRMELKKLKARLKIAYGVVGIYNSMSQIVNVNALWVDNFYKSALSGSVHPAFGGQG